METDPAFALSLALVVAVIYLILLRLIDLNEKEPVWSLALVLFAGAIIGAIATAVINDDFRVQEVFGVAITAEVSKFIALAVGVAALEGISRLRGWSEFNGVIDGLVYGAAAGLGFAVGEAFVRELSIGAGSTIFGEEESTLGVIWTTLLNGLAEGLFGAIIGAALAAALVARSALLRLLWPLAGLALAILAHAGYEALADAEALSGNEGLWRKWAALLLPIAFVLALMVQGLRRESRAISEELADEAEAGVVSEDELKRLRSAGTRRSEYARMVAKGDLSGWLALRSLHNRQVQLALTERRARNESDPARKREAEAEVHAIRNSILAMKSAASGSPAGQTGGAA